MPLQELESERVSLMEEVTANKRKMKQLEDNLLYRLTTTEGSLVEDESLIQVLQVGKISKNQFRSKTRHYVRRKIFFSISKICFNKFVQTI